MNSSQQILYIADDNEIRSLDPGMPNWRYEQTFQGDASVRIDAMDLHIKTNRIFWTNWHTGRISSYELPGPSTSSSPSSSNSHRNRRQSEGRITNLQVTLDLLPLKLYIHPSIHYKHITHRYPRSVSLFVSRLKS